MQPTVEGDMSYGTTFPYGASDAVVVPKAVPVSTYEGLIVRHPHGETEGRDPSEVSRELLEQAGHGPSPLLKVLRAKCLDCCCCHNAAEVRRCTAVGCALWPYRLGKNPFSNR